MSFEETRHSQSATRRNVVKREGHELIPTLPAEQMLPATLVGKLKNHFSN